MLRIVVCMKHVPDTQVPLRLDANEIGIEGADIVGVANPADLCAVEQAVRIVEEHSGEVILVSMGPVEAATTLRQGLALGASQAILICDPALRESDAFVTAVVLARLVKTLKPHLILCGTRSLDGSTGQVGPAIAEALELPHLGGVTSLSVLDSEHITAQRKLERGFREVVETKLPALITVHADLNRPRYASLPCLLDALVHPIKIMDLRALGIPPESVGAQASLTQVAALVLPRPRLRRVQGPSDTLSAAERIQAILAGGTSQRSGNLLRGPLSSMVEKAVALIEGEGLLTRGEAEPGPQSHRPPGVEL